MALGDDLHKLASSITDLIEATAPVEEKVALRQQLTAVSERTERLIRANLDSASAEYVEATRGLVEASTAISAALADLSKVAATIETVAKVVDLLGKLAAKAGPA